MSIARFLRLRRQPSGPGDWAKSSLSSYNGNCVEVAGLTTETTRMRDSKNPRGEMLTFTDPTEWDAFLAGVRNGEFDGRLTRERGEFNRPPVQS